MQEKIIKKILEEAGKEDASSFIVTRPLSDNIDYAKVWPDVRYSGALSICLPLSCYFIRQAGGEYIAGIIDSQADLFWYLSSAHRKPEILAKALKAVILPHILQQRPIQRLTISKGELGERAFHLYCQIALQAGFRLIKEEAGICRYLIEAAAMKDVPFIAGTNSGLTAKRVAAIKADIASTSEKLQQIRVELELKKGLSLHSEDLGDIIQALAGFNSNLE